ncbi:MAG: MotA/TolQ/ExbB proton channel family protein [Planctomycetota bacterium]
MAGTTTSSNTESPGKAPSDRPPPPPVASPPPDAPATVTEAPPTPTRPFEPTDLPAAGREHHIDTHARQRVIGRRRRPMLEWAAYAGAMAAGVIVLVGRFVGDALRSDASHITMVILGLFVIALVKNFVDTRFLARQMALADRQIDQLRRANNIFVFLQTSSPSLFRDHIDNLYEIFRRDTAISQDNLVTLMHTRLMARNRPVDFASSVLVTLGLVGTIVGLIVSSGAINQVVGGAAQAETADMLEGMRKAVGGMGVAFYTTLMGAVLGGVCLRLLSNLAETNTDHIVAHVAELTEIYILPILRRAARLNERNQQTRRVSSKRSPEADLDARRAEPLPADDPAPVTAPGSDPADVSGPAG